MKKDEKNLKSKKVTKTKKKKENFIVSVKKELANVSWPTRKNVFKYTVATILFILFISALFLILGLGLSVVKGWF